MDMFGTKLRLIDGLLLKRENGQLTYLQEN